MPWPKFYIHYRKIKYCKHETNKYTVKMLNVFTIFLDFHAWHKDYISFSIVLTVSVSQWELGWSMGNGDVLSSEGGQGYWIAVENFRNLTLKSAHYSAFWASWRRGDPFSFCTVVVGTAVVVQRSEGSNKLREVSPLLSDTSVLRDRLLALILTIRLLSLSTDQQSNVS